MMSFISIYIKKEFGRGVKRKMLYIIFFENEKGFNVGYNVATLNVVIYDKGIHYHYHPEIEETIEDVEKMEYVNFDLTKEEREEINKKLVYIRFLKEQK